MEAQGLPTLLQPVRPPFLTRLMTLNFKVAVDIPFKQELQPFLEKLVP
jgi:hypothetical protein